MGRASFGEAELAVSVVGCLDVSVLAGRSVVVKKLLFVVNDPSFFLSHRLPLAIAARNEGFNVQVATMGGGSVEKIEQLGFTHHTLSLSRSGRNPLIELITFFSMWRLFLQLRPDLVHLVTIKPVLYGGIAARLANVPGVISAISGLGFLFVTKRAQFRLRIIRYVVLFLYRLAMSHSNQIVIFQNLTDMNTLVMTGGLRRDKTRLIRGSGVDLSEYNVLPEPDGIPVIVMASRLLKDKGVYEFVEAARILQSRGIKARFQLIGVPDPGNPESVPAETLQSWHKESVVECLGFRSDIHNLFSQAHVITLPSYREGLPKVLIEAAACGRAVITTDTPGCRDAIESNLSGLLVHARDAESLTQAMLRLLEDVPMRQQMGRAGRILAEREFGIEKVVAAHITIYHDLLGMPGSLA
jgi:glycosyltransferase involved in cell wall biosynthesis